MGIIDSQFSNKKTEKSLCVLFFPKNYSFRFKALDKNLMFSDGLDQINYL